MRVSGPVCVVGSPEGGGRADSTPGTGEADDATRALPDLRRRGQWQLWNERRQTHLDESAGSATSPLSLSVLSPFSVLARLPLRFGVPIDGDDQGSGRFAGECGLGMPVAG